jgi:hypothetical protein
MNSKHDPDPTTPMRKIVGAVSIIGALFGCAIAVAAPSSADCFSITVPGSDGSRCDSPPNPDGSFTQCDTVNVLGFGGRNCYTVYP